MLKTFYSVIAALTGSDAQASVASAKGSTNFLMDQDMPEKASRSPSKGLEEFSGIQVLPRLLRLCKVPLNTSRRIYGCL